MQLFMDVHTFEGGVSTGDVAKAHAADLATQGQQGVEYLRYWADEAGNVSAWLLPRIPRSPTRLFKLDRAAILVCLCSGVIAGRTSTGAAASLLSRIADRAPLRLFSICTAEVGVTLLLAAAAVVGGYVHLRPVAVPAGVGFAAATLLHVIQEYVGGTNTLGGDGSSPALHLGFTVGLFAIGLARISPTTPSGAAEGES